MQRLKNGTIKIESGDWFDISRGVQKGFANAAVYGDDHPREGQQIDDTEAFIFGYRLGYDAVMEMELTGQVNEAQLADLGLVDLDFEFA